MLHLHTRSRLSKHSQHIHDPIRGWNNAEITLLKGVVCHTFGLAIYMKIKFIVWRQKKKNIMKTTKYLFHHANI
jgi:hypothetical protein